MSDNNKTYHHLSACSCSSLRKSARVITHHYEAALRPAGIKQTQFTILATLANTGPVLLTRLAELMMIERTGLTRNLTVLKRKGWVTIQVGAEDSRQRVVTLSDQGFQKLDQAVPYWEQAQHQVALIMQQDAIVEVNTALGKL